MRRRAAFGAILAGAAWPGITAAQLFKCVAANGRVTYQADPCEDAKQQQKLRDAAEEERGTLTAGGVELLDVQQVARRLQREPRPALLVLYSMRSSLVEAVFAELVPLAYNFGRRGVAIHAFSTDPPEIVDELPRFLRSYGAPFAPVAIRPWKGDAFARAVYPLGIEIPHPLVRPLLALRDREGKVRRQAHGVTVADLAMFVPALDAVAE